MRAEPGRGGTRKTAPGETEAEDDARLVVGRAEVEDVGGLEVADGGRALLARAAGGRVLLGVRPAVVEQEALGGENEED